MTALMKVAVRSARRRFRLSLFERAIGGPILSIPIIRIKVFSCKNQKKGYLRIS